MKDKILTRFFRYVKIDTQSQEDVADRYPSTEKQKDLSKLLVKELRELGLKDAEMDEHGYVMATYPANIPETDADKVPVIGFLAHVDTSPEVSGKDVKPVVHENYQGGDIALPGDESLIIQADANPALRECMGHNIITSDGTTLLGADNKAGIAEILTMIEYLNDHPDIKHGRLRIGFTPDEEVGTGTKYFDVEKFNAVFGYTVDGETVGEIDNETFNASVAVFTIKGINVHPGYAKGKMVNAIRIAADLVKELEIDPSPETTEKREGYLHPYVIDGGVEQVTMKTLIRDFDKEGIEEKSERLRHIRKMLSEKYPRAVIDLEINFQYDNMKVKLDEDQRVLDFVMEAARRAGVEPKLNLIRGGTDGARLCFKGLLTPNIFTGGHNFHSKQEWISVQDMEKTVETLVHLTAIWVEKSLSV